MCVEYRTPHKRNYQLLEPTPSGSLTLPHTFLDGHANVTYLLGHFPELTCGEPSLGFLPFLLSNRLSCRPGWPWICCYVVEGDLEPTSSGLERSRCLDYRFASSCSIAASRLGQRTTLLLLACESRGFSRLGISLSYYNPQWVQASVWSPCSASSLWDLGGKVSQWTCEAPCCFISDPWASCLLLAHMKQNSAN